MEKENLNCVFFDEYDEDGKPCGAVKCDDKSNCEHCGHNPIEAERRAMLLAAKFGKKEK